MPTAGDTHGSQLRSRARRCCVCATSCSCRVLAFHCGRASSGSPCSEGAMLPCSLICVHHSIPAPSPRPAPLCILGTVQPAAGLRGPHSVPQTPCPTTLRIPGTAQPAPVGLSLRPIELRSQGLPPAVRCPLCPRVPAPPGGAQPWGAHAYPHSLSAPAPSALLGAGRTAGDVRAALTSGTSTLRPC